ncbi:hypothetical protein, partial [Nocardioides sp.]|uniref:hypothetical protein n=1 Tax=Nocardioides sp. TaxID=35761 RepID=UPI00326699D6
MTAVTAKTSSGWPTEVCWNLMLHVVAAASVMPAVHAAPGPGHVTDFDPATHTTADGAAVTVTVVGPAATDFDSLPHCVAGIQSQFSMPTYVAAGVCGAVW